VAPRSHRSGGDALDGHPEDDGLLAEVLRGSRRTDPALLHDDPDGLTVGAVRTDRVRELVETP